MSEEEIFNPKIICPALEELKGKYQGVNVQDWVDKKIKYFTEKPFKEKEKKVWWDKIGSFVVFVNEDFKEEPKKEQETKKEEIILSQEALENFKSPDLLEEIKQEISKDHLEDDNLKMTAFLVSASGLLMNQKKRMSMALTGESSVGKDNVMKSVLKHMPEGSSLFLTGATQPAIEDEAMNYRILALSEMNLFREGGANRGLLEVVKQKTEGGTSAIKKDAVTNFKTTKHERTEQGCVLYGTTDAERNNETETRFIFGSVEANEIKITKVNQNTINKISDIDKLLSSAVEKDSWIKEGLSKLIIDFEKSEVLIPYASILMEKIDGRTIIDQTSPRSMRDLKRLLALVSSTTFIHAYQRKFIEKDEIKIIISEPEDLINTLRYSKEFFNETYTGMDKRLNQVLLEIDRSLEEWNARDFIQRKLQVSINTIKSWVETLEKLGLVEWMKGSDLNFSNNSKEYSGNKIYLKRCQKDVKKLLIRCEEIKLKELLEKWKVSMGDTFFQDLQGKSKVSILQKDAECSKKTENTPKNSQIDTFELTPLEKSSKLTPEQIKEFIEKEKELGVSDEDLKGVLEE